MIPFASQYRLYSDLVSRGFFSVTLDLISDIVIQPKWMIVMSHHFAEEHCRRNSGSAPSTYVQTLDKQPQIPWRMFRTDIHMLACYAPSNPNPQLGLQVFHRSTV